MVTTHSHKAVVFSRYFLYNETADAFRADGSDSCLAQFHFSTPLVDVYDVAMRPSEPLLTISVTHFLLYCLSESSNATYSVNTFLRCE